MKLPKLFSAAFFLLAGLIGGNAPAEERFITVASTTSTEQSGLFAYLLPIFERDTAIKVRVVALGTGQALDLARRGDADVVFVHDRSAEDRFIAEGWGIGRRDVMYNDFILVGPKDDPAHVAGRDILGGLRRIAAMDAASRPPFVSRGDQSGTHAAELRYWKAAGVELDRIKGRWYRDTGSGMGPALNVASSMSAYILAEYGVILVNPAKHPEVKKEDGQRFIDWLVSPAGQKAIAGYEIAGQQLFFPNAGR